MRQLALLHGRGLVTPIEVGQTDAGAPYVTRRFVDGPSLDNLVPVSSNDMDAWTTQIAWFGSRIGHAINALHDKGMVHGSIRPSNIFVTGVGSLHVTDVIPRAVTLLGVNGIRRRPDHVAPEVLAGEPPELDADVYSMASVLRGLVGHEIVAHLPLRLRMLFDEALDARPGRRPPVLELIGAFEEVLGEGESFQPPSQAALPVAPSQAAIGPPPVDYRRTGPGEGSDSEPDETPMGRGLGALIRRLVSARRRTEPAPPEPVDR